jgi:hypothetical protein
MLQLRVATLLALLLCSLPALAQEWRRYVHPELGFSISLPIGVFEVSENTADRLQLSVAGGEAQLDVFGITNPEALSVAAFREMIEAADPARRITYRAGGRSWFVLSGFLEGETEPTIFYAKFMLSRDGTSVSAFEISYPEDERARFDDMVERIEDSLTAPR